MDYTSIILAAAKSAKVSGSLLLAICTHESNLKNVNTHNDGGSTSWGICQVKLGCAQHMGFRGIALDLTNPTENAKWAATYLRYQMNRYDGDTCRAVAAYNAGSFIESKKFPGRPVNMGYIRKIQSKLSEEYRSQLICEKADY